MPGDDGAGPGNEHTDGRLGVLWLIKGMGHGGAEQLLVLQARHADHRSFRYTAAHVTPGRDALAAALEAEGVPVRGLPGSPWRWPAAVRRLLRENEIHVVHVHSPAVAAVVRPTLRTVPRARRPGLVVTEHNSWRAFHPVTRWANALTYGLDDATLAVSPDVRDSVWPLWRGRVETLVHGIDLGALADAAGHRAQVRRSLGLQDGDVAAVTVANFRPEKAYPDLLRAARTALDRCDRLVFLVVGQGPLEAEVRREAERLRLGDRFRILGHRTDVLDLLAASDLFVLASRHEGFPVAVMEALASGLPVVSTRVGGLPEAVTPDVEGLLVEPGRPDALADAVVALARDAGRRAVMAEHARRRGGRFDVRTAVRRLEEIYRVVATAPPSSVS